MGKATQRNSSRKSEVDVGAQMGLRPITHNIHSFIKRRKKFTPSMKLIPLPSLLDLWKNWIVAEEKIKIKKVLEQ